MVRLLEPPSTRAGEEKNTHTKIRRNNTKERATSTATDGTQRHRTQKRLRAIPTSSRWRALVWCVPLTGQVGACANIAIYPCMDYLHVCIAIHVYYSSSMLPPRVIHVYGISKGKYKKQIFYAADHAIVNTAVSKGISSTGSRYPLIFFLLQ